VPRIAPSRVRASACDKEQVAPEAIERTPGIHVNPPLPLSLCRTLPRVRDSLAPGSWEGRVVCGINRMYAFSPLIVRKSPPRSSRRTRRADSEHHPPTAQRSAPSSTTPSTWPISGEERRRAIHQTALTAAGTVTHASMARGCTLKQEPRFRQSISFAIFSREQQPDRLRTRARSEARAVAA
jgi:hypothetical protein